jgi:Tol biopolymer transport system component
MPLPSGFRIGPYEVLAPLGAGGMGEVYRARDTKLNRDVAIKVLPKAFAQDAERMARFQREAQVLAALNHPNIAQIYGMEEAALIMELVPGDDLRGPLPLDEAMAIARQISDALESAHEKGIVHRDLKPANIKVTPDGRVKLLDFGLAKAMDETSADVDNSPTLSIAATRAGAILGTASYMSPEQAKGKPVDARADVWAYGAVLYELVTGKKAFPGDSAVEAMAAVIGKEPDWSLLPPGSPVELLKLCLQKDPKQRLRHIGDSSMVGQSLMLQTSVTPTPAVAARRWSADAKPLAYRAIIGVLIVALALTGWIAWRATRPAPLRPLLRFSAEIGGDAALARVGQNGMLAISPDGTRLAVTFRGNDGKAHLGTRSLQQSQITPLVVADDAMAPFFSPDSQWIGFFSEGKLKKISADGGAVVTICDAAMARGASWGDDGNIVFASSSRTGLMRVSSDGGTPLPLTKLKDGEISHRWPQVLPGSRLVLYTAASAPRNFDDAAIEIFSLKTGQQKILRRGGYSPRYLASPGSASGHLVYLHGSTLFAVPLDLKSLSLTGASVPILDDVSSTVYAGGDFDFSRTGEFLYLAGSASGSGWLMHWLESSGDIQAKSASRFAGKRQVIQANAASYFDPRLSPDGKRLVYSLGSATGADIWVKDLERDTPSRLSFQSGLNRYPVWTPDGRAMVFVSTETNQPGIYWMRTDGSGEAVRLSDGKSFDVPTSFSPDGRRLAFYRVGSNSVPDILTAPISDAAHPALGEPQVFLGTPSAKSQPMFSPDGRWLAYDSNESGAIEIYVRPFPGPGGKWQISSGGGQLPRWSRDGRELLFEKLDSSAIMAASYSVKGDTFTSGVPRVWLAARLLDQGGISYYDPAPDGKRIVALLPSEEAEGQKPLTHLTFLLNFFDELRRKAPGKN